MQDEDSRGLRTFQRSNRSRKRDPPAKERPGYWPPLYPGEDQSSLVIREPPPLIPNGSPPQITFPHLSSFDTSIAVDDNNVTPASPPSQIAPGPEAFDAQGPPEVGERPDTAQASVEDNPFIEWRRRRGPSYIKSTISKDNTSADRTEAQEGLKFLGQRFGKQQNHEKVEFGLFNRFIDAVSGPRSPKIQRTLGSLTIPDTYKPLRTRNATQRSSLPRTTYNKIPTVHLIRPPSPWVAMDHAHRGDHGGSGTNPFAMPQSGGNDFRDAKRRKVDLPATLAQPSLEMLSTPLFNSTSVSKHATSSDDFAYQDFIDVSKSASSPRPYPTSTMAPPPFTARGQSRISQSNSGNAPIPYPKERDGNISPLGKRFLQSNNLSDGYGELQNDYRLPDWRARICQLSGIPIQASDDRVMKGLEAMAAAYNTIAKDKLEANSALEPTYHVLHRIYCGSSMETTVFHDAPYYTSQAEYHTHMTGVKSVPNVELHIVKEPRLSFVVFMEYSCCQVMSHGAPKKSDNPAPTGHKILPVSEVLCKALSKLTSNSPIVENMSPAFEMQDEILTPYLWVYHSRGSILDSKKELDPEENLHLDAFMDYINEYYGSEFATVDDELEKGMISPQYLKYPFVPNQVIVLADLKQTNEDADKYVRAYLLNQWPTSTTVGGVKQAAILSLTASFWEYDGVFQWSSCNLDMEMDDKGPPILINTLKIYPIDYAKKGLKEQLRIRGQTFWDFRVKNLVCYNGWDFNRKDYMRDTRFMVDLQTYRYMHPDASAATKRLNDTLGPDKMASEKPPEDNFVLLLPASVYGFNMLDKKWINLLVDNMSPVLWNKNAFASLALDEETKVLITALVTNNISANMSVDIMSGKGNGLIVLLHGGPGTGKTLTAESVAEIVEKPLYRVTCGDIGTNAEDVEKYLTVVLHLGKIWDCVVLLDEAEVFLQERSLKDLQRNALVSVFLRVLEYYEGILILTSNRVGTFDEAFKSRIQLALRYEPLNQSQRRKVWENFINKIEEVESDTIDSGDLRRHIDQLATFSMNGRQIRNAMTTARQLAKYKDQTLDFKALKHVINVSGKFDNYLKNVNEGLSDEDLAREERLR